MRANTACQNMIPVDKQMMRSDSRRHVVAGITHKIDTIGCCDML